MGALYHMSYDSNGRVLGPRQVPLVSDLCTAHPQFSLLPHSVSYPHGNLCP